jgi:hypothetical protein
MPVFQILLIRLQLLLLVLPSFSATADVVKIVSNTTLLDGAPIRYHYAVEETKNSNNTACRSNIILLGVGTAMKVEDYDQISTAILHGGGGQFYTDTVVVILDAAPRSPVKLCPKPFAHAANKIVASADLVLPVCPNPTLLSVIVGGHSASGAAAFHASVTNLLDFPLAGFVGLDPFLIRSRINSTTLHVPALYWGFSKTTCLVQVSNAAMAAYQRSEPGRRVFFQIQNSDSVICPFSHCAFADSGCPLVCPSKCSNTHLLKAVGMSVRQLLRVINSSNGLGNFTRRDFELKGTNFSDFALFMDAESRLSENDKSPSERYQRGS